MVEELDFYQRFELENQGYLKTEEYINQKYDNRANL